MSFLYEEKASSSRFVDVVWHTVDTSDGTYIAAADACWDMIFTILAAGGSRVLLSGPSSRPTAVPYRTGNRSIGVRFTQGSYFTHIDPHSMCDRTIRLPILTDGCFELAGRSWTMPDYDRIDVLLAAFDANGLLANDPVIAAELSGAEPGVSARSVQRHFERITGQSPRHVRQVTRARKAVARLRAGEAIAEVAYELGYADQSHLTREVKRLTGYTPAESQRRDEPV
ncbi:helix-turn-helix transcriptional regulator [Agromyces sp. NPDC049794]|uniref:helix-turn-helix transcriptional regulator n=1 Tax=unclassified Agromyces TaxID=2639701 RepID=UPI0033CB1B19